MCHKTNFSSLLVNIFSDFPRLKLQFNCWLTRKRDFCDGELLECLIRAKLEFISLVFENRVIFWWLNFWTTPKTTFTIQIIWNKPEKLPVEPFQTSGWNAFSKDFANILFHTKNSSKFLQKAFQPLNSWKFLTKNLPIFISPTLVSLPYSHENHLLFYQWLRRLCLSSNYFSFFFVIFTFLEIYFLTEDLFFYLIKLRVGMSRTTCTMMMHNVKEMEELSWK